MERSYQKSCPNNNKLYISLYLPSNPIGFVKTLEELRKEVCKYFKIEIDIVINKSDGETILLLGKKKK